MAKIYFRYGAMNSSKTSQALMVAHNYKERGQKVIFYKPIIDNRDGLAIVKSRCGISSNEVHLFDKETNLYFDFIGKDEKKKADCVIVDECQFLSKEQVKELCQVVDTYNIPVICYGLRTNFKGELFEGSKYLMALADSIEEVKTICWVCDKKAIMNARVKDGVVIKSGEEIQIGGNESYIALCRKHWKEGKIS